MLNKHKDNNKGFSLIELLVAIAILAVVMIPMLHSFVTSARTNAKSRKIMEATSVAQNVFEELKASDLDTYLAASSKTQVMNGSNPVKDVNGNTLYAYSREFSNLDVNGRKFRARVTLDPQRYTTTDSSISDAEKKTNYNTVSFSNLSNLSKATNAFYIQKSDEEIKAAKDIDVGDADNVMQEMSRHIKIDVEHDDSTNLSKVYVTVTYKDERTGKTGSVTPINHQEIFNNSQALENSLSNVFVCFYPMYNSSARMTPKETIEIQNQNNSQVCVYLVKQTARDDVPAYAVKKNFYSVGLIVDEGDRASLEGPDGKPDVKTSIATNLAWNSAANLSELQIDYRNQGVSKLSSFPHSYTPDQVIGLKTDLQKADTENKVYEVTVEVYEENDASAKVLTKLKGTKIQ